MNLREFFASLGNTPDEVAESFRKLGVKGIRKSTCKCPVINAIYHCKVDTWSGLRISGGRHTVEGGWHYSATFDDPQICDPTLPRPVRDFIGLFDTGAYPDLEAKAVREEIVRVWE